MTEINNIEEVKRILDFWLINRYDIPNTRKAEVAELICQLFPQPLDEGLKVLVAGEWVEASKELKDTVRSIEQALPSKELREKIEEKFRAEMVTIGISVRDARTGQMWAFDAERLSKIALALLQPRILGAIDTAIKAYESTCESLIQEANNKWVSALKKYKITVDSPEALAVSVDILVEEARRQEGERIEGIFEYIEAMFPELDATYWKSKRWRDFKGEQTRQALSGKGEKE